MASILAHVGSGGWTLAWSLPEVRRGPRVAGARRPGCHLHSVTSRIGPCTSPGVGTNDEDSAIDEGDQIQNPSTGFHKIIKLKEIRNNHCWPGECLIQAAAIEGLSHDEHRTDREQ